MFQEQNINYKLNQKTMVLLPLEKEIPIKNTLEYLIILSLILLIIYIYQEIKVWLQNEWFPTKDKEQI